MEELSQDASAGGSADASPNAADSSSAQTAGLSGATDSISSVNATTSPSEATQDSKPDILATLPSVDELRQQGEQGVKYAASLAQVRSAYEEIKPQYEELNGWRPVIDTFGDVNRANTLIQQHEALNAWETDPNSGALVPSTRAFVDGLEPMRADTLTSDLLLGETEVNGQRMSRLELVLNTLGLDPKRMGDYRDIDKLTSAYSPVEPEELEQVPEQHHALYRSLSPEIRNELKMNNPLFIEDYLNKAQAEKDRQAADVTQKAQEQQRQQQQEQAIEQAAMAAGDAFVDREIRAGLSGLINSISEEWKPTDNAEVNSLASSLVGCALVALANKDTRFAAEDVLAKLGLIDKQALGTGFDTTLNEFVVNSQRVGYLQHKKSEESGYSTLAHKASTSRQAATAQMRGIATRIIAQFNNVFTSAAINHNQTLDAADRGRPIVHGQAVNPATNTQFPPSSTSNPFSPENNQRVVSAYR